MLPKAWKPVLARGLKLVGPPGDGSYVVAEKSLEGVTLLLSMGLSDDWSFEEEFVRQTGARVVCFDGSVNSRFWLRRAISWTIRLKFSRLLVYPRYRSFFSSPDRQHRQLMIGYDRKGYVSLDTIFKEFDDRKIFLKADIEGGEYRILDQIVKHKDRFTGIAMEFHDVDLHRERIDRFLADMNGFSVIALHPNNFGGVDRGGDPLVFELAMARNELLDTDSSAEPIEQRANKLDGPEIEIVYA